MKYILILFFLFANYHSFCQDENDIYNSNNKKEKTNDLKPVFAVDRLHHTNANIPDTKLFEIITDSIVLRKLFNRFYEIKEREIPIEGKYYIINKRLFKVIKIINTLDQFAIEIKISNNLETKDLVQIMTDNNLNSIKLINDTLINLPIIKTSFGNCGKILINNETREQCNTREMNNYLGKRIEYPQEIMMQGLKGEVLLKLIINKNGILDIVEVVYSPSKELTQECLKVIKKMKPFSPAILRNGETCEGVFYVPIKFGM